MTSIEWLKQELEKYGSPFELIIYWETLDELLEQAKERQKVEQEISNKEILMLAKEINKQPTTFSSEISDENALRLAKQIAPLELSDEEIFKKD